MTCYGVAELSATYSSGDITIKLLNSPWGAGIYTTSQQIGDIKPILRKLEDMTDGELTQCVRLDFGYANSDIFDSQISKIERHRTIKETTNYGTAIRYVAYDKEDRMCLNSGIVIGSLNPTQFQYLLSKHFDLFGLIELGLAIDIKKLTKSESA